MKAQKKLKGAVVTADLTKTTVGMMVQFSRFGNRRKVKNSQIEVDADKELISVSKQLLEADEFDAILQLDGEVYRWLDVRALPSELRKGIWLMPTGFIEDVTKYLKDAEAKRSKLVDAFLLVYAEKVKYAKKRLRELFNELDYPSVEHVKQCFRLRWQYLSFGTPTSIADLNQAIFDEEKAKAAKIWEDTAEMIVQLQMAELSNLTGHLIERLDPSKDGKKKIIRDSVVSNIKEYCDLAPIRNATNNDQIKKFITDTKKLVATCDPESLRNDEKFREKVQADFSKLKKIVDKAIADRPTRVVSLDDEV